MSQFENPTVGDLISWIQENPESRGILRTAYNMAVNRLEICPSDSTPLVGEFVHRIAISLFFLMTDAQNRKEQVSRKPWEFITQLRKQLDAGRRGNVIEEEFVTWLKELKEEKKQTDRL